MDSRAYDVPTRLDIHDAQLLEHIRAIREMHSEIVMLRGQVDGINSIIKNLKDDILRTVYESLKS